MTGIKPDNGTVYFFYEDDDVISASKFIVENGCNVNIYHEKVSCEKHYPAVSNYITPSLDSVQINFDSWSDNHSTVVIDKKLCDLFHVIEGGYYLSNSEEVCHIIGIRRDVGIVIVEMLNDYNTIHVFTYQELAKFAKHISESDFLECQNLAHKASKATKKHKKYRKELRKFARNSVK